MAAILTTILAGKTANEEKDIKKIVAISTLSQLGIIIIITAISIKRVTMLHTNTHALFKALLFMTVGRIIEKKEGSQKKKNMTSQESKTSSTAIMTANITLIRLPITSSFFSKDAILENINQKGKLIETLLLVTTAVLTTIYSLTIIKEVAKRKKSIERKEKIAKKRELLISSAIVMTRAMLVTNTEQNNTQIYTEEKFI